MTSPQPPAHRPRKDGRWPLQRPTLPPGVSDGRGWVTVNRPTRPDRDPARLINRRACALRFTLTRHISSILTAAALHEIPVHEKLLVAPAHSPITR